jgi:DNA-binding FadR family transcriptional regulator
MNLKKISLVDLILWELRKEIVLNLYPQGGQLPSEKELVERFKASRLTVRSAVQALAREGFIDIVQGKGNLIRDYRKSIMPILFPDFLSMAPGQVISYQEFSIFRSYIRWLHGKVWVEACRKATEEDEKTLNEINAMISEKLDFLEIWQAEFRIAWELLRIGNNLLLMMHYNYYVDTIMKLIKAGIIRESAYPFSFYKEYPPKLFRVICHNNMAGLFALMPELDAYAKKILNYFFEKAIKDFNRRQG